MLDEFLPCFFRFGSIFDEFSRLLTLCGQRFLIFDDISDTSSRFLTIFVIFSRFFVQNRSNLAAMGNFDEIVRLVLESTCAFKSTIVSNTRVFRSK